MQSRSHHDFESALTRVVVKGDDQPEAPLLWWCVSPVNHAIMGEIHVQKEVRRSDTTSPSRRASLPFPRTDSYVTIHTAQTRACGYHRTAPS